MDVVFGYGGMMDFPAQRMIVSSGEIGIPSPHISNTAKSLMDLLYHFDSKCIPESLLVTPGLVANDPAYKFLEDRSKLDEVVGELTSSRAIRKDDNGNIVLFERNFWAGLCLVKASVAFSHAVQVLEKFLPDFGRKRLKPDDLKTWETVKPHILRTMEVAEKVGMQSQAAVEWMEVLLRAGWYALESQLPELSMSFIKHILQDRVDRVQVAFEVKMPADLPARVYMLQGHVHLDLARPQAALDAFRKVLDISETLHGPQSSSVAEACESLALAYSEMRDGEAFAYLRRADAIHAERSQESDGQRLDNIPRIQPIRALALLRAGTADEALSALQEFWRAQHMSQVDIEAGSLCNYSGDVFLLARIYWAQGKAMEAQELASRTIAMRRALLGASDGGPRMADSLFLVALILEDRGLSGPSINVLNKIVDIEEGYSPTLKPHIARACWFLANIEERNGADAGKVSELRSKARQIRESIKPIEGLAEDTNEAFMRLVSWVLW